MKSVELRTAYCWHCDECSELNFCESVIYETTEAEKEEVYRYFHDLEDYDELPDNWRDFQTVCKPGIVKCRQCNTEFETEDEVDPDEEWTLTEIDPLND